ncbi:MAG: DUF4998 domain-containing protein, partial [Prevotellaceae bacterium]|nr:DUF4998 domain-containing protein [Prevotellaceae bacterium]
SIQAETELNLPESGYVFEFVTKDDDGHRSLPVSRSVTVYGDKYISFLQNRDAASVSVAKITWTAVSSSEIQYTTVQYTDYTDPDNPVTRTLRVENGDTETELPGAKSGETLSVTTSFLPANGIDTVDALPKIYTLQ